MMTKPQKYFSHRFLLLLYCKRQRWKFDFIRGLTDISERPRNEKSHEKAKVHTFKKVKCCQVIAIGLIPDENV
jgi:hypothetical protein